MASSSRPPRHADPTLTHPPRIGPYRVIERIASGGMAEIYLAQRRGEAGFQRVVVIKRMLPHLAHEPELRTTLLDEARLMARLRHPNIVGVQEFRRDASDFYLVMEYLRGDSISELRREMLARGEHMHPALAVHIVSEICAGLHAAHELRDEKGELLHVVHRDVSPQNVFITFDGEVKILDFGIACFDDRAARTGAGMTKGKLAYMSPEQFGGEALDRRADVFAVGVMLHELLTGKRLFARASEANILRAVLHDPIPLPSQIADDFVLIPEALDAICMKALARERDERFATTDEMREKLRELMPSLDPRQRARERLVEMTRRVLPRRFAETEALMRRALGDSGEINAPEEPSTLDGAAAVEARLLGGGLEIDVSVEDEDGPARPPTSLDARRAWFAAIAACAIAGCVVWFAVRGALARTVTAERGESAAPVVPAAHPPLPQAPPPAPEPSATAPVRLHFESEPSGARVSIDGQSVGLTPLDHQLDRSSTPRAIAIDREGYVGFTGAITPETDQRIVVRLTEAPASPRRLRRRFFQFD